MLWQEWEKDYGTLAQKSGQELTSPSTAEKADLIKAESDIPEQNQQADLPIMEAEHIPLPNAEDAVQVQTDLHQISISRIGGGLEKAELLKYPVSLERPDQPTLLLDNTAQLFYIVQGGLLSNHGGPTHKEAFFTPSKTYILSPDEDRLSVPLSWESDTGVKVTKQYEFSRGSYLVGIRYQINNQSDETWSGRAYGQFQRSRSERESWLLYTYSGAAISSPEKRYEKISFSDMENENLGRDITNGWVAMLQHYFVSALLPAKQNEVHHYYTKVPRDNRYIIGIVTPPVIVAPGATATIEQRLYLGPKLQRDLEKIAPGLELTADYGVLWFIAEPLFWCLQKFHQLTGNWGWAIVLVTVMLKLLFFQLSAKGYKSMAKMRQVQPRLLALKERYQDDRARLNQAMMDMYKKEKINPLSGCFPILVQIPVFIALYWTLLESVELRQTGFIFWIVDLSRPDPYFVLPLMMGATMLVQQKLNPAPIDPLQQKVIMVLPFVFTVFFAFFPSGLVLYWVVNNILSIAQQWVITRQIEGKSGQLLKWH